MPNGSRDFREKELPALESFFAPMAGVLCVFGSKHNLMLVRYYHEFPSWRFNFRHPKGGVASLEVMKASEVSIKIYLYWWVDDYGNFTRLSRSGETPSYGVGDPDLPRILEEQFRKVLSWEPGGWTQVATVYEQSWSRMGKKWHEQVVESYPMPTV